MPHAERGAPAGLASEYSGPPGAILTRIQALYPKLIDLSLGRLESLLARLGHPERSLPPVVHVAGTNGKGSTCANMRAIAEAGGLKVHVMTSPHLVDVTERIRLAGTLVSEADLVAALEDVERINDGQPITVFEVLTAAGFLLFSRVEADLLLLEVGLSGRLDATNTVSAPCVSVITPVSLDHQAFLGATLAEIAYEKAGIIRAGVPVVVGPQPPGAMQVIRERAAAMGAPLFAYGEAFSVQVMPERLSYHDAMGRLSLPLPSLVGVHQIINSAVAVAALRVSGLSLSDKAYRGIAQTVWPARLQILSGRLASLLPEGWQLWLDGGHNPDAGAVLAQVMQGWSDRPVHVMAGVKQTKDAKGFLQPWLHAPSSVWAVREEDQPMALSVDDIVAASGGRARVGPTVREALETIAREACQDVGSSGPGPARVLICGSLYLAGSVLRQDGWLPC